MIQQLLENRGFQLKKKTADEYSSACPFCGGTDRFCIWPDKNRAHCIRGCDWKGDDIQLLRDLDGLSFKEAAGAVGRGDNGGRSQTRPTQSKPRGTGKLNATWDYLDEQGHKLYQVQRLDTGNGKKEFPTYPYNGEGNLVKKRGAMNGVRLVLYNLPRILKASTVWFPEGEKCADIITSLELGCATCNPGGAGKIPFQEAKHKILGPLKGKSVYILPDNDEPGRKHSEQLAKALHDRAKEVKIVNLPGLPEKGDLADYLEQYGRDHTVDTLIKLAKESPLWTPPKNFFSAEDLLTNNYEKKPPIIGAGIMPWNSHIILSGETGIGKSLLRLELALHLVMGWDWLGFDIPTSRKVTIFQYENSEPMEQTRLKKMCEGLGIRQLPKGRLIYADRKNRVNLTLKKDRERLLQLVKESEGEVIIYDCLSNLHSSKENDNVQMRDVLDTLTEINTKAGTSCILIHHFGKPSEGQQTRYRTRGAQSIVDWSVTAMAFTVRPHEHKILRQLEFIKVRDGATPRPLLLERDESFLLSISDEGTLCSPGKVRDILDELGGEVDKQGVLIDEIVMQVGCSRKSAKTYIRRAVELLEINERNQGNGRPKGYFIQGQNRGTGENQGRFPTF